MLNLQITLCILSKALQLPSPASIFWIIIGPMSFVFTILGLVHILTLLPPDPGFLTADRHHPVISRCFVLVHL